MKTRPSPTEYAERFSGYVSLVPESEILPVLEEQLAVMHRTFEAVSGEKEHYRYAPGKWSIREVCGHLIDAERILGYRAFCFSRGEKAPLPSWDENTYIAATRYDERPLSELFEELTLLRKGNLHFLRSLSDDESTRVGTAGNNPVSVRAIGFIITGHARHHIAVLRERYGVVPKT